MKKLGGFLLAFLLAGGVSAEPDINHKALGRSVHRAAAMRFKLLQGAGSQFVGTYAEDSAHTSGHFGSMILGVRRDTPTSLAGADNDYMPPTFNSVGALWVAGNGTFTVGDGAGALNVIVDSITAFPDNEPFNIAQINGVTPLMGNGVTGTGSQRVTIASDNTAFSVNANAGTGNFNVVGTKSSNGGVPGSTNLGTLPSVATAAAPTYTEGNQVALSTDLAGSLRVSGGGGGTQYTEGDVDATITGTAAMMEGAANTLVPAQGTVADGLLVNLGTNNDVTVTSGTVNIGTFPDNEPVNVAQFGGAAVVTGTGAGGAGIPRVTVSNDSAVVQGTAAAGTAAWPVKAGNVAATTAAWTSATADETTLSLAVTGFSTVLLSLNATSTMTAGQIEFEANDGGSIWFARQCIRSGTTTLETFLALSVIDVAWQCNVAGFTDFRVRLSTVITGTGTANLRLQASEAVLAPYTTVQGTVTANAGTGTFTVGDGAGAMNVIVDSITAGDNDIGNFDLEFAGVASAVGNGVTNTETQRVTVSNDSTGILAGVTTVTNLTNLPNEGQQTAANSISVTPDTDNDSIGTTGAAVPGEATLIAGTDGTNVTVPYIDPCERESRTVYRVDIVTATTTEIAAAVASEFYWICSINLITAAANNVIIVEDDTATNCPSPTAGVSSGGTTAAEGYNFGANGGIVAGTGQKWVMKSGTANRSICIITSAATQLSGTITYVSAP